MSGKAAVEVREIGFFNPAALPLILKGDKR